MCVFGCCWISSLAFNGYVTMYVFWTSIRWIYTMHVPNTMKICNVCSFFVTKCGIFHYLTISYSAKFGDIQNMKVEKS